MDADWRFSAFRFFGVMSMVDTLLLSGVVQNYVQMNLQVRATVKLLQFPTLEFSIRIGG
jgi:hypothetical protein